jgi:hypothetical protein
VSPFLPARALLGPGSRLWGSKGLPWSAGLPEAGRAAERSHQAPPAKVARCGPGPPRAARGRGGGAGTGVPGRSMRSVWPPPPVAAVLAALGVRRGAGRGQEGGRSVGRSRVAGPGRGGARAASPFGRASHGGAEGIRAALDLADVDLQAGHAGRGGPGGLTLRGRRLPQRPAGRRPARPGHARWRRPAPSRAPRSPSPAAPAPRTPRPTSATPLLPGPRSSRPPAWGHSPGGVEVPSRLEVIRLLFPRRGHPPCRGTCPGSHSPSLAV